jgi:DNA-binding transcriptional LysR family regulator
VELRHLRYVVAVAEELHFSRAARRLNMSQPPLSQQIQQLEDELGVKLFERSKRLVTLTEAGHLFIDEARRTLAQADYAAKVAIQAGKGGAGQLSIGATVALDGSILVAILRTFINAHPNAHLVLRKMDTVSQIQALRDGRIDVGFLLPPVEDPTLAVKKAWREEMVIALPEKHRLARRRTLPLRALLGEPYIMFSRNMHRDYHDQIVSFFQNTGASLNVVHEADTIHTTRILVAAGLGVSVLPAFSQADTRFGIAFRKIQGAAPQRIIEVAYRRDARSELLFSFLGVVEAAAPTTRKKKYGQPRDFMETGRTPVAKLPC